VSRGRGLDLPNVATWLVLIYAVLGAILVMLSAILDDMDPTLKLSFGQYLAQMAIATAGLAIGRGIKATKQ
jgi:hypothetical protein